jgi:hypothetical protein
MHRPPREGRWVCTLDDFAEYEVPPEASCLAWRDARCFSSERSPVFWSPPPVLPAKSTRKMIAWSRARTSNGTASSELCGFRVCWFLNLEIKSANSSAARPLAHLHIAHLERILMRANLCEQTKWSHKHAIVCLQQHKERIIIAQAQRLYFTRNLV